MSLIRYSRIPEMLSLREAMDRMFDEAYLPSAARANGEGGDRAVGAYVPFDVSEREDEIIVRAPVPGFRTEDIEVTIQGNVLTVTGTHREEEEREDERYHLREWRSASFRRAMTLPEEVDSAKANAEVADGVLMLTLPKSEAVKPRKIEVRTR